MPEQTQGTGGTPDGQGGTPQAQAQTQTAQSFAEFIKAQPPEVQGLYEADVKGLKTSLDSERTQRAELAKQLKDLLPKAEKGSELEKLIGDATTKLEEAERRATFFEEAGKPDVGCQNARLAYLAAQTDGLIDQKGRVNWEALKTSYPELFRKTIPAGNAGNGAGTPPPAAKSMNDFIRRAAGRNV